MTTKLTLSVEKRVVQKAKLYARTRKKSLSEIVTTYLDYISSQGAELQDIDPEVLEASGQISLERIPDLKDPKYQYLKDKYLHE
jgi:hypothetical protein